MLIIINFLQVDNESTIWVLTNKMPKVIYSELNFSEKNFYILKADVKEAIKGSMCDVINSKDEPFIFSD